MLSTNTILDALKAAHNTPGIKPMQLIVMKESMLSSRITLFSDGKEKWALAMEKVIMSTNGVQLQTNFYGNCYQIPALKQDADFSNMMVEDLLNILDCEADWDGDYMPENPSPWMMRGLSIELEQDPAVIAESVPWCNGEQISLMDQLCYLAATKKDMWHADTKVLSACLPQDVNRVLVVEEWQHRDPYHHLLLDVSWEDEAEFLGVLSDDILGNFFVIMAAKEGDAELAFHRYPSPTWDPHWDITFQMFAKVLVTGDPELFEAGQFTNSGCFSRMGGEVGFSENGEVSPISPEDIDSPISPISPLSFLLASRH